MYLYLAIIYITDNWFDPPSDITAIPQSYTVHCVIIGELKAIHYYYHDTPESELTSTYCSSHTGYNCSLANNKVTSAKTSDNVVDKTITVTWEAEEISSGAFRQDSNHGDHKIGCYAKQSSTERESIVSVRGKYYIFHSSVCLHCIAPSLSPSDVTVVSKSNTSVTISWAYNDISDADGYVVYVNDSAIHNVIGGARNTVTLHGLIPGRKYSIIVRAYQDILGPPSIPLIVTSGSITHPLSLLTMYPTSTQGIILQT